MDAKLYIPKPCHEDWNKMTPTEKGRFCSVCSKEVKDFRGMSKPEIIKIIAHTDGEVCGNFNVSQLDKATNKIRFKYYFNKACIYALAFFGILSFNKNAKAQGKVGKVAPLRGRVTYYNWEYENTNQQEVTVSGSVKNVKNEKIGGAVIEVWSNNKLITTVKSIANGSFSFTVPPKTAHNKKLLLKASAENYLSKETEIILDKNQVRVEISLGNDYILKGEVAYIEVSEPPMDNAMVGMVALIPEEEDMPIMGDTVIVCETINPEKNIDYDSTHVEAIGHESAVTQEEEHNEDAIKLFEMHTVREEDLQLNIFPNPTKNVLNLNMNSQKCVIICVFDMQGKNLMQKNISANAFELDISDFESGTYLIKVKLESGFFIEKKFIKL